MQNAGSMEIQMVEHTKPAKSTVPTSKHHSPNTQTHRKIPHNRPENVQQAHPMPDWTCTHQRVLQTFCSNLSQLAMGCVTRHTCHGCVTDFRPILGNPVEVTHVTSPGHVYIFPR